MSRRAYAATLLLAGGLAASLLLIAGFTHPSRAQGHAVDRVRWDQAGDFASALSRAHAAKKLVFVDFYATWCGPCKLMDRDVYTDSVAAGAANHTLSRKIDAEAGEGPALAERYAIHFYPTLLVLDDTGKERARQTGYLPADRFARFVDDARTGRGSVADLEAHIAKGEDTFDNRAALVQKAIDAHDLDKARAQLPIAVERDSTRGHVRAAELWLTVLRAEAPTADPATTLADGAAWLARFPEQPGRVVALTLLANAHAARAEKDSALVLMRQVRDAEPGDAGALTSFARFCATQSAALDEGLAAALQAVDLSRGKDPAALDALADVYAARRQFDHAVDAAQRALDLNPGDGARRGRLETFEEQSVQALHAPSAPSTPQSPGASR
jgi:thiol-disulfide isomerase/thioredoxin